MNWRVSDLGRLIHKLRALVMSLYSLVSLAFGNLEGVAVLDPICHVLDPTSSTLKFTQFAATLIDEGAALCSWYRPIWWGEGVESLPKNAVGLVALSNAKQSQTSCVQTASFERTEDLRDSTLLRQAGTTRA